MTCREVEGCLARYLEGELASAARRRLHDHLAGCAACRAGLESYRATIALTRWALLEVDP